MVLSQCFLYSFPFLESTPKYLCTNEGGDGIYYQCGPQDFCDDPNIIMKYNFDDSETIDNMITQFKLECASSVRLGLIGSSFLVGIVIGSVTITRIGDTYGRIIGFGIGIFIQSIVAFMILFTDNYNMACLFVFLTGISVTGK
jgi:hypothetical protein